MHIQNGRGPAVVILFRPRLKKSPNPRNFAVSASRNEIQVLKGLRSELRCIKKAIRILEGLAAQTETKPRTKRQISV
jgi:hypothetical protein